MRRKDARDQAERCEGTDPRSDLEQEHQLQRGERDEEKDPSPQVAAEKY